MLHYIVRRLIALPFILALINFFVFAFASFGRWVQASRNPYIAVAQDQTPLLQAYAVYLRNAWQAGFGEMPTTQGVSILDAILEAGKASLGLLTIAFALSALLGVLIGFRSIRNEPAGVRGWLAPLATVGLALPSFYIGALLIAFLVYFGLFGIGKGRLAVPIYGFGWDDHLILPVIALMIHPTLKISQSMAVMLSGELGRQYVVAARSLGQAWRRIRGHLALRNVLAPLTLIFASNFRWMIAELIVVEVLFGWPGIGRMLAMTITPPEIATAGGMGAYTLTYLNAALMATIATVFAFFFLLADLIASLLVHYYDPRLRAQLLEAGHG